MFLKKGKIDIFFVVLLMLLSHNIYGQRWEKNFGEDSVETATFIRQTLDGGFITCGTSGITEADYQVYALRIDQFGKKVWEKKYGTSDIEVGHAILELEDGGFMVLGSKDSSGFKRAFIFKIDAFGNFIWQKDLNILGLQNDLLTMTKTTDGIVIMGTDIIDTDDSQIELIKIDQEGNIIWENLYGSSRRFNVGTDLEGLDDGGFVIVGSSLDPITLVFRVFLAKLDKDAVVLWGKVYESLDYGIIRDIKQLPNGGFILCGESRYKSSRKVVVIKTDSLGTRVGERFWTGLGKSEGYFIDPSPDGSYVMGYNSTTDDIIGQVMLTKVSANNIIQWDKSLGDIKLEKARSFQKLNDGGYAIAGFSGGMIDGVSDIYIWRTNATGDTYTDKIFGKVYADLNTDCTIDIEDIPLGGWVVSAIGTGGSFFTITDLFGNYSMLIDTGTYQVSVNLNEHPSWKMDCGNTQTVVFDEKYLAENLFFGAQAKSNCNEMFVDLGVPKLERCSPARYIVSYANRSGNIVNGAFVEITIDPYLIYQSSTIPFSSQNGNVYTFPIGNLNTQEVGDFSIDVLVACDSTIIGEAYFVKAHIFPDDVCLPSPYNGPNVEVSGQCTGDSVQFRIKNIKGPMGGPKPGIVIQDEVIRLAFNYQLGAGEETILSVPAEDGKTFRLQVNEDDALPLLLGDSVASYVIEGCVNNRRNGFNTGFVTLFPQDDETNFIAIDYKESVLPNGIERQIAQPEGYDEAHFIAPNSYIDYTIHFENENAESVNQVEVIDTLSKFLDIKSFEMGARSHNLIYELHDDGVLKLVFNNIALEGTNQINGRGADNILNRSGFVKFRIKLKDNLQIGTVIKNNANVYFDYERPRLTNEIFHTVGSNFVRIALFVPQVKYMDLLTKVFPNPMSQKAIFYLENFKGDNFNLELFDISGKLVATKIGENQQTIINRNELNAGTYIFKISENGDFLGSGKLIIE